METLLSNTYIFFGVMNDLSYPDMKTLAKKGSLYELATADATEFLVNDFYRQT